ncbi:MAG: hypothetical protein A3G34_03385 [Candidatus Lindowbacteria bacterium RIFCSPLOWO2_12_FULL_62_27]|nr:MAG: hypothetical protein A3I06_07035 [Candidatus Lindowbacteria bacterium RIFCSPLOWO2_02_FULL_62_12]OGH62988.1 MAG: hypothetical protein A3G34_03385 [Candidatus Lindowbacteria bacterium RIFCSPLOWO2_12_FULL_62_27]
MPDLSLLLAIEELDQKRREIDERLKEIPARRERLNAELARLDRSLSEKEQSISVKEKSISTLELDCKTSQTQEADKKVKLNSVKTQKEYDALKEEIELANAERGKLEEKILLLMDEISELKNLVKRDKQAAELKKKEIRLELDALAATEKALQDQSQAANVDSQTRLQALPEDALREYKKLRAALPEGRILSRLSAEDNTYYCSACNSPVSHQIVINMKKRLSLSRCDICHRLLYL